MVACPVCETDNPPIAVECAGCGKVLRRATEVPGFAPPIDGLEPTLQAAVDAPVERVPELERTALASHSLRVPEERLEVERTPHETNGAAQNWTAGPLELDRGREEDPEPRAAPPIPPPDVARRQAEPVLCPACFARVAAEARCAECGVPLPIRDA
jgi:hypothetical protein